MIEYLGEGVCTTRTKDLGGTSPDSAHHTDETLVLYNSWSFEAAIETEGRPDYPLISPDRAKTSRIQVKLRTRLVCKAMVEMISMFLCHIGYWFRSPESQAVLAVKGKAGSWSEPHSPDWSKTEMSRLSYTYVLRQKSRSSLIQN